MDDTHSPVQRFPRKTATTAGIVLLVLVVCYSMLQSVSRSPFLTHQAQRYLSDLLQQPVSLQGVNLSFGTISLTGLTIGNPAGAAAGNLATVHSISVSPAWSDLLLGKRVVKEVTVSGMSVDLVRDRRGEWNFAPLLRKFGGRKKGGESPEVVIRRFRLDNGMLTVNGRRLDIVSAAASDIATKGSEAAQFTVKGKVAAVGSVSLTGTARLGSNPAANVSIEAPSLSLAGLQGREKSALSKGKADVVFRARLVNGVATGDLAASVAGVEVKLQRRVLPVALQLRVPFRYDSTADKLVLDQSWLQVNRLLTVHISTSLEQVRSAKKFAARLYSDELRISDLAAALPGLLPDETVVSGRLLPIRFALSGEAARGIAEAQGELSVRDGEVVRRGKTVTSGVAAGLEATKQPDGWQLHGRLDHADSPGPVPVRNLAATFSGRLDEKMHLVEFEATDMSALVAGSNLAGFASLRPSASMPFTASVKVPQIPLRELNSILKGKGEFEAGNAAAAVELAGRSPAAFTGTVTLDIRNATGKVGTRPFSADRLHTGAAVERVRGAISLQGSMALEEGAVAGKPARGDFRYGVSNDSFSLGKGHLRWGDVEADFDQISGPLPVRREKEGTTPVHLGFRGLTCRKGDMAVRGMAGTVDGAIGRVAGRTGFSGSAELAGAALVFRHAEVGTAGGRLEIAGSRGEAKLSGSLLGGTMSAALGFDPSAKEHAIHFDARLVQIEAAKVANFGAYAASVIPTAGKINATARGVYAADAVSGAVTLSGDGLSLASGRKTLVAGAGFTIPATIAGGTITIRNGRAWAGSDLQAFVSGEVVRAFSPERQGVLSLRLPTVPATALLDAFANILPRPLQEGTATGTLTADSTVQLRGKQLRLDGTLAVAGMSLEVPVQQVSVTGIRGTLPFSAEFPAGSNPVSPTMPHPSRDSYPTYLYLLEYGPERGELLTIDRLRFGAVELADILFRLEAADGTIRINSLQASLADGTLVGRGYLAPGTAGQYGGDLLVNDFSLRAFCSMIPAIKDYISGKVDGIVSVAGTGKGVGGLNAFIDLWARGTKEEKMLVSKEFLQKLAGKNIRGLFFRKDRPYDRGEISGYLTHGYLTFDTLDISHTNFFGVKDLSVSVAPVQNKIALDHLVDSIKQAAARSKGGKKEAAPPSAEFSWEE